MMSARGTVLYSLPLSSSCTTTCRVLEIALQRVIYPSVSSLHSFVAYTVLTLQFASHLLQAIRQEKCGTTFQPRSPPRSRSLSCPKSPLQLPRRTTALAWAVDMALSRSPNGPRIKAGTRRSVIHSPNGSTMRDTLGSMFRTALLRATTIGTKRVTS